MKQITAFPKTLLLVTAALGVLLLLPGIPVLPILTIMSVLLLVTFMLKRAARLREEDAADGTDDADAPAGTSAEEQDAYAVLQVEPIEVQVGTALAPLVGEQTIFMDRIAATRKQYALDYGMVLPRVRFRESRQLGPNAYELRVFGVLAGRGEIMTDRTLAIHAGGEVRRLKGIETREPTYGLPAVWIEESEKEAARTAKYTLVDAATVFITHLSEVLKQQAPNLLTRSETDRLLARVRTAQPGLVEELIPTVLSVGDVQKVLQNLLKEKVSIRNLEAILETLADCARGTKDLSVLTELVRQKLGAAICQALLGDMTALQVMTLEPQLEQTLMQSVKNTDLQTQLVVEPKLAEQLLARLSTQSERMMKSNMLPVLLCSPDLRRHLRSLSERVIPHMRILSMAEIPNSINLKAFCMVSL